MLIRSEDAASMIRLRNLPDPSSKGESSDVGLYDPQCNASTARIFGLDQEVARNHVRYHLLGLESHGVRLCLCLFFFKVMKIFNIIIIIIINIVREEHA